MRFWFLILLGCGPAAQPAMPAPTPKPAPPVVVAPPVPSTPQPRLDRAPLELGGPATWGSALDVVEMRFCPGDRELVTIDNGMRLRRYRVDDGAQLAATRIGETKNSYGFVDCRADGNALAFDNERRVIMVDPKGTVISPPSPLAAEQARFDDDGSVLAITDEGVTRWNGDKVEQAFAAHANALTRGIGEHGSYFEIVFDAKPARENGLWLVRNGARIALPQRPSDVMRVSAAPDGAVAVADMMTAYVWNVRGKVAGARKLLLDMSGSQIRDVIATTRWFVALGGGSDVTYAKRSTMKIEDLVYPCGEGGWPTAIAMAHDDKRIAIACSDLGIRIFDLEKNKKLSTDLPHTAGTQLAWSPDGKRLALRSSQGFSIWRGPHRVARINASGGRGMWWESETELGGAAGWLMHWKIVDGALDGTATRTKIRAEIGARSPHGEIVAVSRAYGKDSPVAIVRDDQVTTVTVPESKYRWPVAAAIDNDGKRAVVLRGQYSNQPSLEAIEVDVAAHTATLREETALAVAMGKDGYALAQPGGAIAWRAGGKTTPIGTHAGGVKSLAIAGDVIAAGGDDGTITLWTTSGKSLGKLAGHTAAIRALAFTPDGKQLASTAGDGTRIWDLTP